MTTYNRNFAKAAADMIPLFAPVPLRIAIPHHEEWDEDIIDPETSEPTGDKEHKSRDWTEYETVLRPTAEKFALAGYKPLYDNKPSLHEQGKHWERTGKIKDADTYYFWEYILVDDLPPPPRRWTRLALKTALA